MAPFLLHLYDCNRCRQSIGASAKPIVVYKCFAGVVYYLCSSADGTTLALHDFFVSLDGQVGMRQGRDFVWGGGGEVGSYLNYIGDGVADQVQHEPNWLHALQRKAMDQAKAEPSMTHNCSLSWCE